MDIVIDSPTEKLPTIAYQLIHPGRKPLRVPRMNDRDGPLPLPFTVGERLKLAYQGKGF